MAKKRTSKKTSRRKQDQILGTPDPATEPTHPAPKPLTAILGHDRPVQQLTAAIESERLHHAWVFHGPKGVGKLTTALAFAALDGGLLVGDRLHFGFGPALAGAAAAAAAMVVYGTS